jgi:hypothetical protein
MAIAEAFLLASLKKTLESISSLGVEKAVELIQLNGKQKALNHAVARIRTIENVKTLWQIDKEISIYDFFVPPKATYLTEPLEITEFSKLPPAQNLIVEGILGQGKSILLRHLAMSCLKENLLPIFISAHTITPQKTLREKVREYFSDFGKKQISAHEVDKLLDTQFFVLFLDGFDEVTPSEEIALIEEIRSICRRHGDSLRVIVSSRPDNAIQKCEEFRVLRLNELDLDKRNQLIQKLYDSERARELIGALRKVDGHKRVSDANTNNLLKTPLMVVILLIVYNAERRVPETFSEFFEHLFEFLLVRHDGTKPGFSRSRTTKIANSEFRHLFEAFCFCARKRQLPIAMGVREVEDAIKLAADTIDVKVDPSAYVDDVKKVTCLLIEEGLKLHFVHHAIQYFFSAQYIRSCAEEDVRTFYESRAKQDDWEEWAPELGFLRRIDAFNFYNYFYVHGLERKGYFRENRLLSDDEVTDIASQVKFEFDEKEVRIQISPTTKASMAERDFLVDFFVTALLNEALVAMLGDQRSNAGLYVNDEDRIDLRRSHGDTIKHAANKAAVAFRSRLAEFNDIKKVRSNRAALLNAMLGE